MIKDYRNNFSPTSFYTCKVNEYHSYSLPTYSRKITQVGTQTLHTLLKVPQLVNHIQTAIDKHK